MARRPSRAGPSFSIPQPSLDPAERTILTARLDPRSAAEIGRPVTLAIDASRLYYFDPETEIAL